MDHRSCQKREAVLAEKPAALNAADLEEILDVCNKQGVQFMDGVMFMHSARLDRLREVLLSPSQIGTLRRIACQFSFAGNDDFAKGNIRVNSHLSLSGVWGIWVGTVFDLSFGLTKWKCLTVWLVARSRSSRVMAAITKFRRIQRGA